MKDILQQVNTSVDGVIGSAVFSQSGNVLVQMFPALIDDATLKKAASVILECAQGLQISQTLGLLDLRYSDGRILVKAFPGAMLFLLCTSNVNLNVLSITINLAIKKLEAQLSGPPPVTEQQSKVENPVSEEGLLRMTVSQLANKQASASFDSLGMIAVSQPTSHYITTFHKTPFKKLTLTNSAAGTSGTFPVMVMKDMDQQYDGTIILGPGIVKKLKVSEGDKVEVKIG